MNSAALCKLVDDKELGDIELLWHREYAPYEAVNKIHVRYTDSYVDRASALEEFQLESIAKMV